MTSQTRRTRLLTALTAVAAIAAAVLVVGPGYEVSRARMRSGTVWLASSQTGEVTMVDGAAAEVRTRVPVAEASTALTVAQRGGSAIVLNRKTGRLNQVDGATEQISPPVAVLPPSDGLVVLTAPGALHVIDVHNGMTAEVDPASLTPKGEPRRLAETIRSGSVVVDGGGRVWAIDDTTGDLAWLDHGERRNRATATKSGHLTIANGTPVLVDPEHGTAELLDPGTGAVARSVRLDVHADDEVVVSGSADSSRLLIAIPSRGSFISCSFDTASCAEPVQVGAAGAELGAPVESGNHAVVPDNSTGQATIVDLAAARVVAQRQLFEQPTRFEMITRDGIVFFNDPNGAKAGVLDLWGEVRTITKYTGKPATQDPSPTPGRSTRANDITKVGQQQPKVGLGLPRQTDRPGSDVPAPGPTASIVVKPGDRGVVGDEFELTIVLVLRPASGNTTRWSFGDGAEASGSSVRHSWSAPGVFTVRATATINAGKQVGAETTVTVDPPGAPPRITSLNVRRPKPVIGEPVHFSADTGGKPDRWEWTVTRRGLPATEVISRTAEFDHAFAAPGHYTVALTVARGSQTAQSSQEFTVGRGVVKAWGGENFSHELDVPQEARSGVIAIDAGNGHALALKANGQVVAWGRDNLGQATVPDEARSGVTAIVAAWDRSLALKADGSVIIWGGERWNSDVPERARHGVVAIAAGWGHNLALKSDGSVVTWGGGGFGLETVPQEALSGVVSIAAGPRTSLALKADGSIVVWGDTMSHRQGPVPARVLGGVRAIAAGEEACLALKQNGSLANWGDPGRFVLMKPRTLKDAVVVAMDYNWEHALVVKSDGTALGWGPVPGGAAQVPAEYNSGVVAVAAGSGFSMLLREEID
ncbi:PKD domain-containing protein [Lentzea aerocolonigenes]|uniref:PKD domain-containing protein n=1 Tax=Lentzea aerocolonigenes TaxID=68170 RepID=UPI000695F108|nr:PKD domain-containing protein [Lentzea aerocolonigenes]